MKKDRLSSRGLVNITVIVVISIVSVFEVLWVVGTNAQVGLDRNFTFETKAILYFLAMLGAILLGFFGLISSRKN